MSYLYKSPPEAESLRQWIEAMQMTKVDSEDAGYERGLSDAITVLRQGMDDNSAGDDLRKIYDACLSAAEFRIRSLSSREAAT